MEGRGRGSGLLLPSGRVPTPASTYRLQVRPDFDLWAAAGVVDYVHRLGADWVYLSPLLQAQPGSDHGYDVAVHSPETARRAIDDVCFHILQGARNALHALRGIV